MAILVIDGQQIHLRLSTLEQIAAFWPAPHASIANVAGVEFVDNLWSTQVLQGVRAPGTGLPWVVMIGLMRRLKTKDFCVIKGRKPGVVITFASGPYQRWIYTLAGSRHAEEKLRTILGQIPQG